MNRTLKDITERIVQSYREDGGINHVGGVHLPSRDAVASILLDIEELCFPGFIRDANLTGDNIEYVTGSRVACLADDISAQAALDMATSAGRPADDAGVKEDAFQFAYDFLAFVPELRARLRVDVQALLDGDPAARSREEVILSYPGLRAVVVHRVASFYWRRGLRLLARMMSEIVHSDTGIDIHPGATIGASFHIDHGTGVVIGETCVIGEHVKLYQGVSLGAHSVQKRMQDKKRHPTLEDHVTIYAGATILGGDTVVGHHSIIGGNVWLVKSVAPFSIVEREAIVKVGNKAERGLGFDPGI